AAEPAGVGGVLDLAHAPPHVVGVAVEEALDVVAVHGPPAVEAELPAEGRGAAEVPHPHRPHRRVLALAPIDPGEGSPYRAGHHGPHESLVSLHRVALDVP